MQDDPTASTETVLNLSGRNSGNLLIGRSLVSQLQFDDYDWAGPYQMDRITKEEAAEKYDLLAIPSANFLNPAFDMGHLAGPIEKLDLPCFMVGLGAQAPGFDAKPTIPEGTIRFVKAVADRTKKIGVRGEYTAELLDDLGIKNVQITGCPSLYANRDREFRVEKSAKRPERIAINGNRTKPKEIGRELQTTAFRNGWDFILQNEMPETIFARGILDEFDEAHVAKLVKNFGAQSEEHRLIYYLCHHFKIFFDLDEWEKQIRQYDFTFGTRFHGNVISLINKVPCLVLTHDSRTLEMCRFFSLPHQPVEELEGIDAEKLYDSVDFGEFNSKYAGLYDQYVAFFESNGIDHRL